MGTGLSLGRAGMVEFAQIVHVPSGPSPAFELETAESRVTHLYIHPDGRTMRASVHVLSPVDMARRTEPIVVDVKLTMAQEKLITDSEINYRLRTVPLRDAADKQAVEYALFRGLRVSGQDFATHANQRMPEQDDTVRPLVYLLFEQALRVARTVAAQMDAEKKATAK